MIVSLRIENFAIIDQLLIELRSGFSVFSGETGAGKSILITALNLLLGERAYTDYIRSGEESATVEGVFKVAENSPALRHLKDRGIDLLDDGEIWIKRKIYQAEKSNRCYINHQPCPLSLLAEVGRWLVDIHGQHEHQLILSSERQIDILDAFGNLKELRARFAALYRQYEERGKQLLSLLRTKQLNQQEMELLRFQMQEIDQANLSQKEEERLDLKRRQLQNAERLSQELGLVTQELYEGEGSLHDRLGKVCATLRQLAKIDDFFSTLADSLENISYQVEEISSQCTEYLQGIEFDPHLLDELEAAAAQIQRLKRKYGPTVADILETRARMEEKWQAIQQTEDDLEGIQKEIGLLSGQVLELAEKLSAERQRVACDLEQRIKKELADLALPRARFQVSQQREKTESAEGGSFPDRERLPRFPFRLTAKGADLIEFLFSANQGEELKPLARIASGGEVSRILLALKCCLRGADEVPVLVFDEVDVGIGGDISRIVGRKLKELSASKQVLCITHSPQIASLADHHYVVRKVMTDHRTSTMVEQLRDDGQRIGELARMLGGGVASEITFTHARELIEAREP